MTAITKDSPAHAAITTHSQRGEPPREAGKIATPSLASRRRLTIKMDEIASRMIAVPS